MSRQPLSMSRLIELIGNDRIAFQMLNDCFIRSSETPKNGHEITFGSCVSASDLMLDRKVGIIIWVAPEDLKRARRVHCESDGDK